MDRRLKQQPTQFFAVTLAVLLASEIMSKTELLQEVQESFTPLFFVAVITSILLIKIKVLSEVLLLFHEP